MLGDEVKFLLLDSLVPEKVIKTIKPLKSGFIFPMNVKSIS
jgi:hypothetical protein